MKKVSKLTISDNTGTIDTVTSSEMTSSHDTVGSKHKHTIDLLSGHGIWLITGSCPLQQYLSIISPKIQNKTFKQEKLVLISKLFNYQNMS